MNQQRSRRFRAAREESQKFEEEEKLRKEWADQTNTVDRVKEDRFDSNCITPGIPNANLRFII